MTDKERQREDKLNITNNIWNTLTELQTRYCYKCANFDFNEGLSSPTKKTMCQRCHVQRAFDTLYQMVKEIIIELNQEEK